MSRDRVSALRKGVSAANAGCVHSYLRSPIVELGIGPEDDQVTLTAHQGLLERSPFFSKALEQFSEDVTSRRIDMPSENLDAMGCFLQFLYTDEYYPRLLAGDKLEIQEQDDGTQLLRHGRIYTLAQKFQVEVRTRGTRSPPPLSYTMCA